MQESGMLMLSIRYPSSNTVLINNCYNIPWAKQDDTVGSVVFYLSISTCTTPHPREETYLQKYRMKRKKATGINFYSPNFCFKIFL